MLVKQGTFNLGSGGVGAQVSITGIGFQPDAIIVFGGTRKDDNDFVGSTHSRQSIGAAVSATSQGVAAVSAQRTTNDEHWGNYYYRNDNLCAATRHPAAYNNGIGDYQAAKLVSMDADGFTVEITSQDSTSDWQFHYLAINGVDNAHVGQFDLHNGTGQTSVTGVGFQPDAIMFFGIRSAMNRRGRTGLWESFVGFSDATTHVVTAYTHHDASTSDNRKGYIYGNECIAFIASNSNVHSRKQVASMDADGFTIENLEGGDSTPVLYLALKVPGGAIETVTGLTQTTTGLFSVNGNKNFQRTGVLYIGGKFGENSQNTNRDRAVGAFGASDGVEERTTGFDLPDGSTLQGLASAFQEIGHLVSHNDYDVIEALAKVDSLDTQGITLNQVDTCSDQHFIGSLQLGSASQDFFVTLTDPLGLTDTVATSREIFVSFGNLVEAIEAGPSNPSTSVGRIVSLANSLGLTDVLSTSVGRIRSISDTVGLTDTLNTVRDLSITLSENLDVTDTLTTARDLVVNIVDSLGITDTLSATIERIVSISDDVGLTDTLTTARDLVTTLQDNVSITDAISTSRDLVITLSDNLGITDTVNTLKTLLVTIQDSVGLTDVIATVNVIVRTIQDSVSVTDTITNVRELFITFIDNIGLSDTLRIQVIIIINDIRGIVRITPELRAELRTTPIIRAVLRITSEIRKVLRI